MSNSDITGVEVLKQLGIKTTRELPTNEKFKELVKKAGKGNGKFIGYFNTRNRQGEFNIVLVYEKGVKHFGFKDGDFVLEVDGLFFKS